MNSVRSNNIGLKYQRFTTLASKDIGNINSKFVAKTQFLFCETREGLWMIKILKNLPQSNFEFYKI